MYPIDFTNCTANDVIARSVTCHPTLFAERLRGIASIHGQAATTMHDRQAVKISRQMAADCREMADRLDHGELLDGLSFSQRIIAFNAAAKLQCVNDSLARSIIAR